MFLKTIKTRNNILYNKVIKVNEINKVNKVTK